MPILNPHRLHVINAHLPLLNDHLWYELIADHGVWTSITASHELKVSSDAIPIHSSHAIDHDGKQAKVIDLQGRIALPGLVDMHLHLDKALSLPQVGNRSGTLMEAIVNYSQQAATFTKDEIRERILQTAQMGLQHGTIHMRTHLDIPLGLGREVWQRTVDAALEAKELLRGRVRLQLFPMLSFDEAPEYMTDLASELIKLGMDGLGGCPHLANDPEADIRELFLAAVKLGVPIDLHVDERDDPTIRTIVPIAETTIAHGLTGKVSAGHLCSLSSMPPEDAEPIIELMARAKVGAVTLPAANLYLQGRDDQGPFRRGVTRVQQLLQAGVPTAIGSDNIRDPFHPFGKGDLVQVALLTAYAAHMGSIDDPARLLRMISATPATLMQLTQYGFHPSGAADLVVLDALDPFELLVDGSSSRWVAVDGRWVSATVKERRVNIAPA